MRNKENLFSKNKYDVQLEALLDEKNYTDEAKSLVLNILYRIENAYKDYQTIKQNVKQKSEIIGDIVDTIKHRCDTLEILNPEEKQAKLYVDRRKKIIKTFPHEVDLLQAIYYIKTPYAKKIENIFEKATMMILEKGMAINGVEIIRDFNGWSWNNTLSNDNSQYYNLIYQSLIILIGETELESIIKSNNIIEKIKEKMFDIYGENKTEDVINKLVRVCVLIYMSNSEKNKKDVDKYIDEKKDTLHKMQDKAKFIMNITSQNSEYTRNISKIDSILSSESLLKKKYSSKNISEKYKDIETYKESLVKYKNSLVSRMSENKKIMNPFEYIKLKENTQNELKTLNDVQLCYSMNDSVYTSLIGLQRAVIECFYKKVAVYDLKKELIGLVYEIRYYNNLPLAEKKIKSIKELQNNLDTMQKAFINKLCKAKVIEKFSSNSNLNYEITKQIFRSNIIDLNKTSVKLEYKDGKMDMEYYDDHDVELKKTIKIDVDDYKNMNKKIGKKIRIFI
ncbi:MAG: hypothetical protein J6J36_08895 [Clostridia bacterium]|nr:hypothetical protein [Clostridia bacterium]